MMGIMKDNISKVLDRGEKLTDLQEKSGEHPPSIALPSQHDFPMNSENVHEQLRHFGPLLVEPQAQSVYVLHFHM